MGLLSGPPPTPARAFTGSPALLGQRPSSAGWHPVSWWLGPRSVSASPGPPRKACVLRCLCGWLTVAPHPEPALIQPSQRSLLSLILKSLGSGGPSLRHGLPADPLEPLMAPLRVPGSLLGRPSHQTELCEGRGCTCLVACVVHTSYVMGTFTRLDGVDESSVSF